MVRVLAFYLRHTRKPWWGRMEVSQEASQGAQVGGGLLRPGQAQPRWGEEADKKQMSRIKSKRPMMMRDAPRVVPRFLSRWHCH